MNNERICVWRNAFIQARQVRGLTRRELADRLTETLSRPFQSSYIRELEKNVGDLVIANKTFYLTKSRLKIIAYCLGFPVRFFQMEHKSFGGEGFMCCNIGQDDATCEAVTL